jgi:hypothetical protein
MRQLLAGGVPGQGVVLERNKEVKYAPMSPKKIYESIEKTGGFPYFFYLYINRQNTVFRAKVLTRRFLRNTLIVIFFVT